MGYISLKDRSPEDLVSLIVKKLTSSGESVPRELVRRDFSTLTRVETLPGSTFSVLVRDDEGVPIGECQLTVQAENGTTNSVATGDDGVGAFSLKVRRPSTLLASHPCFPAAIYEKVETDGTMEITLPRKDNIGSITIHRAGQIPGLMGDLNPILDSSNRTYLYAKNIAINGGENQPASFEVNVAFELEYADGTVVYATVKHIAADVSLLQYTRNPQL